MKWCGWSTSGHHHHSVHSFPLFFNEKERERQTSNVVPITIILPFWLCWYLVRFLVLFCVSLSFFHSSFSYLNCSSLDYTKFKKKHFLKQIEKPDKSNMDKLQVFQDLPLQHLNFVTNLISQTINKQFIKFINRIYRHQSMLLCPLTSNLTFAIIRY